MAQRAEEKGGQWLNGLVSDFIDDSVPRTSTEPFDSENIRVICDNISDLASIHRIADAVSIQDSTEVELTQFTLTEHDTVSVCKSVDESSAMESAVSKGLESLNNNESNPAETGKQTVAPIDSGDADNSASNSIEERSSVNRFEAALRSLQKKAALLRRDGHPFSAQIDDRLQFVFDKQVLELTRYKRQARRQSKIDDFFSK